MNKITRILIILFQIFLIWQVSEVIIGGTSVLHQIYGVACAGWVAEIQLIKIIIKAIEDK